MCKNIKLSNFNKPKITKYINLEIKVSSLYYMKLLEIGATGGGAFAALIRLFFKLLVQ